MMKLKPRYLIASALCMLVTSVYGEIKLPVVEILGHQYYVYESKKGDSMFGIARKYKWSDATLQKLNPKAMSPLAKGMRIYYPVSDNAPAAPIAAEQSSVEATPVRHLVKKGDTLYSISRLYNISVDKLEVLNPGCREGIKAGDVLNVKDGSPQPYVGENPEFYTVRKGDTLYRIAHRYNTTVAAIMKLNPGLSRGSLNTDEVIKLPGNGDGLRKTTTKTEESTIKSFGTYKTEKGDTWETIAEKTGVPSRQLIAANQGKTKLGKNVIIGIPEIETVTVERTQTEEDPREQNMEGIDNIYHDVHGIDSVGTDNVVCAALLLSESSSRKDLDFTRGFLTGVDRLKHSDYRIKVNVIDGAGSQSEIIESLDEIEPDIIFLTADKTVPDFMAEYSRSKRIPVVNTFDVRNDEYTRNPYFIQLLTPSALFNDEIASYMLDNYHDYNFVIAGETEGGDQLASAMSQAWKENGGSVRTLSSLEPTEEFSLSPEGKYLIYGGSTRKQDVQKLLLQVKKLREENPLAEIVLLGRPNWIVFDEVLSEPLHEADAMIPSRFYFDKDSQAARRFMMYYKSVFDMTPVKSFPSYAAMGFDSSMYFIPSLAKTGGDLNAMKPSEDSVQCDFEFERPSNWSGLMNPMVCLVRFTPFGTVDKIKVK